MKEQEQEENGEVVYSGSKREKMSLEKLFLKKLILSGVMCRLTVQRGCISKNPTPVRVFPPL